jgi:murein L,D-transpeptidase YcbB/YkuD
LHHFVRKFVFFVCLLPACVLSAESSWDEQASRQLEKGLNSNPFLLLELDRPVLNNFYRERDYRPVWTEQKGRLKRADELIIAIANAADEGLNPAEYYPRQIRKYIHASSIEEAINLEMWLSAALYRYANDRYAGRLESFAVDPDWHIQNSVLDMSQFLSQIADNVSIKDLLDDLSPVQDGYHDLRNALNRYRDIAEQGGWDKIWVPLKPGTRHEKVSQLRKRLIQEGDLQADLYAKLQGNDQGNIASDVADENTSAEISLSDFFDANLEQAVKRYQRRHGIKASGELDDKTLQSLNVSVEDRILQVRLNMERWRWLPRTLGRRYLAVNMTGFELAIINDGHEELSMPVIIGKKYRETPALSGVISYFEYNPYWTISKRVMWEKFIPGQIRDASYLDRRSIRVYKGWAEAEEVDPKTIDWTSLDPENNSPYWMRQDPGPGNALGNLKFIFSNPYQIYLHGTPDKHLFNRTSRAFSHGCIRVKDPTLLAASLLGNTSKQKMERVKASLSSGVNEKVHLPVSMPVYLMYWTAWVDTDGVLNFRDDIYKRDTRLRELL